MVMFPDFGEGSCINCGFLSLAQRAHPEGFYFVYEVSEDVRVGQHIPTGWFRCFVLAENLAAELQQYKDDGLADDAAIRRLVEKGRVCKSWYPWRPGFDPRWHFEERRTEALERDRREWERRQQDETQATQREMARISNRQLRISILAIAVGVVATFVAATVTVRCTTSEVTVSGPLPVVIQEATPTPTLTLTPTSTPLPSASPATRAE